VRALQPVREVRRLLGPGPRARRDAHRDRALRPRGRRRSSLLAGVDADKDQSYFLFGIEPAVLARTLFPVGGLRKSVVRAEAARRGLSVAGKPDSQEVCFVPRGGYAAFVERHASSVPARGGAIVDADGQVVATHDGVHRFTIGQRRGLGVSGGDRAT
jgi:tRNA-specific 2-thiouridylase